MAENPRARRTADRIKEIVASMLDTKIKDPRLGFVTVTDVRVTGDLQQASIFYTVLGDEDQHKKTAAALESCKGLLRSEVGKQLGLRLTPSLTFHLDAVPEAAATISEALSEAQRRDAELAALRVGKQYADSEDPYRKPVDKAHYEPVYGDGGVGEFDDVGAGVRISEDLHEGGFDPLTDDEENIDAPSEYALLNDFDSLDDAENADESKVDGDQIDTVGGPHA